MTPVVSIREVMTNIIDPLSDNVFDAVGVEVTKEGTKETRPENDTDWARVEQGAIALAEGSNLLKVHPRRVAPADDNFAKFPGELPPDEIEKKIEADRATWDRHVDLMRDEAIKVLQIVKAKEADKLFEAGNAIDKACESCHLEFWYPGDRAAVERDQKSRTFREPVTQ